MATDMTMALAVPPDETVPTDRRAATRRVVLSQTRSFRRVKPARLWWLALGVAVLANCGVVVALAVVSRVHQAAAPPSMAVRSLRQLDHDPQPSPPLEQNQETTAAPPEEAITLALPSLDLPAASSCSDLRLPETGTMDQDLTLPLTIPAFTIIGPPAEGPVVAAIGTPGPPIFDTPAEREGAFDLERYYPRAARMRGIAGSTTVRLSIAADGLVEDVRIMGSTPAGVFEQAAERLSRSLRYHPAVAAGKPVASTQVITIAWTIK